MRLCTPTSFLAIPRGMKSAKGYTWLRSGVLWTGCDMGHMLVLLFFWGDSAPECVY
ncbi:hypothetical protein BDV29DRAFT_167802 [Aspergillus leporis]|uniref:Uncharacterized protein n=1 Tax=Aspergillus leporis TaxID=41062 RepID=A0A5N5XAH9_9EURO|nr:hypothetical protein BDV29DRAFT_167802 [Aspergillus leporis]